MIEVSNYDFFDYDYAQYWKVRQYEDLAEKHVLGQIFSSKKGKWFVDIGGSYGRLTPTYYNSYTNPILLDYSLKTLQKNYSVIKKQFPNVELIAANAYHMPFKEDAFDGGLMVRVLHHISEPVVYFNELKRVMHNNSSYVQEFANKVNLKASLRAIFHLNFKFFSKEPYQQPTSKNFEGTETGQEAIFFNYHPSFVAGTLRNIGFKIQNKYGCSYLRFPILKKILGDNNMLKIEYILQKLLKTTNIPPSVIYETKLQKAKSITNEKMNKLEDILVCPKCLGELTFRNNIAACKCCDKTFKKEENIWDFRID
jgi:ubiquinone/menaquinone biosynthesis C-methylase UbiE